VQVEELAPPTYLFQPGHLLADALPSLPPEGMSVTFDRARALSREDLGFLSGDHPLVRGSWDLLLAAEAGNAAFGIWRTPAGESILLEIYMVVEAVAPAALHVDRFLPATPIRVVVDHALAEHTEDEALSTAQLEKGDIFRLLDRGAVKKRLLPAMLAKAQELAAVRMQALVEGATRSMSGQLQAEIARLEDLSRLNDHVHPAEIAALREQQEALRTAIAGARLRLDALRLIFRTN
jgi:ATP-dependent helicase HepA